MARIGVSTIIATLLFASVAGCANVTKISYFPDQRGPFVCRLLNADGVSREVDRGYEVVSLPNWQKAFALRKASTNEVVLFTNNLKVANAQARGIYEKTWFGEKKLVAVKIIVLISIENDPKLRDEAIREINRLYAGTNIVDSVMSDIVVDLYTFWLGSEYTRAPCQGVALDEIPFEITLPTGDGQEFLLAASEDIQIAGRVLFRDARSGWLFHRSFTVKRGDFSIVE